MTLGPDGVASLLVWGDANRRDLPWRTTRDPWAILVSEVMLQQTQVERVIDRWTHFLGRWPTVELFAAASLGDVLIEWQGLGYPRRARNLHSAATEIVDRYGGLVPDSVDDLMSLPGVGAYTARAVLAFAFEIDGGVVDTNVGRLLARWGGCQLSAAAAQQHADRLAPAGRSWVWNQTVLDFAAAVCCKRDPGCASCQLLEVCGWARGGFAEPDPSVGSAGVSRAQKKYAGSDRAARGDLLRLLIGGTASRDAIAKAVGVDTHQAERAIAGLIADGLVVEQDGVLSLP